MNISKYIGKTFPAGKSAKELGIDTSRKFVVVRAFGPFLEEDVVTIACDEDDAIPIVRRIHDGRTNWIPLDNLAYLEEEDEVCFAEGVSNIEVYDTPKDMLNAFGQKVLSDPTVSEVTIAMGKQIDEPYVPRAEDRVRLEGEIVIDECGPWIKCPLRDNGGYNSWLITDIPASLTLISRAPRTLTKAEAEKMLSEHLNESITII